MGLYIGELVLVVVFVENQVLEVLSSLGVAAHRKSINVLLDIPESMNHASQHTELPLIILALTLRPQPMTSAADLELHRLDARWPSNSREFVSSIPELLLPAAPRPLA
jgi:hypothetical protein